MTGSVVVPAKGRRKRPCWSGSAGVKMPALKRSVAGPAGRSARHHAGAGQLGANDRRPRSKRWPPPRPRPRPASILERLSWRTTPRSGPLLSLQGARPGTQAGAAQGRTTPRSRAVFRRRRSSAGHGSRGSARTTKGRLGFGRRRAEGRAPDLAVPRPTNARPVGAQPSRPTSARRPPPALSAGRRSRTLSRQLRMMARPRSAGARSSLRGGCEPIQP